MLLQLVLEHPSAIVRIVQNTPPWVGGLLAALLLLGASQLRQRRASLVRSVLMPAGMTVFAVWGMFSAFGRSPQFAWVLLAWTLAALAVAGAVGGMQAPAGARYDPASRSFLLPGSATPMVLILGIFLTKYLVNVELALQPGVADLATFAIPVGALYGVFTGFFTGRTVRLLRLALPTAALPFATA